jgi:hypothetical protein
MAAVNFFLAGAAKSGTTALYHALRERRDIYLPAVKESHVYAYLAEPSVANHLYPDEAAARAHYEELYAPVGSEKAVGDGSTTTLVVRGVADVVAADLPDARFVVVLRQPVERAFAHWRHFVAAGAEDAPDFAGAVKREREGRAPFTYRYLAWSRYGEQLAPFYRRFGRERVLVHLYEELVQDPEGVLRRTLRFLGVDDAGAMPVVGRYNEMPIPRFPAVQRTLHGRGRKGRVLRRIAPDAVLFRRPALDPRLRAELTTEFEEDLSRLEELTDRDLASWR